MRRPLFEDDLAGPTLADPVSERFERSRPFGPDFFVVNLGDRRFDQAQSVVAAGLMLFPQMLERVRGVGEGAIADVPLAFVRAGTRERRPREDRQSLRLSIGLELVSTGEFVQEPCGFRFRHVESIGGPASAQERTHLLEGSPNTTDEPPPLLDAADDRDLVHVEEHAAELRSATSDLLFDRQRTLDGVEIAAAADAEAGLVSIAVVDLVAVDDPFAVVDRVRCYGRFGQEIVERGFALVGILGSLARLRLEETSARTVADDPFRLEHPFRIAMLRMLDEILARVVRGMPVIGELRRGEPDASEAWSNARHFARVRRAKAVPAVRDQVVWNEGGIDEEMKVRKPVLLKLQDAEPAIRIEHPALPQRTDEFPDAALLRDVLHGRDGIVSEELRIDRQRPHLQGLERP